MVLVEATIMNANLETALSDLVEAIQGIMLGSVESVVLHESGLSLIHNWNDHHEDKIDEEVELKAWEIRQTAPSIITAQPV